MKLGVVVVALVAAVVACDRNEAPFSVASGPPGSVGVVVLIDGSPYVYGNTDYAVPVDCKTPAIAASGQPCRIVRVVPDIREGIATVLDSTLSQVGTAGSRGALVFIERTPRVVFEGDLAAMTDDRLPTQRDQQHVERGVLGPALHTALEVLGRMPTRRKALLIVAGNYIPLPSDLAAIGQLLAAAHVDVATVTIFDGKEFSQEPPEYRVWRRQYPALGGVAAIDIPYDDLARILGHWAAQLAADAPLTPPPPRPRP